MKNHSKTALSARSRLWFAGVALLALFSGTAAATPVPPAPINYSFGGGASLTVIFSGDTGVNQMLEYTAPQTPPFSEVSTFSATYTDPGPLGTIMWSGVGLIAPFPPPGVFGDLTSLLFDNTVGGRAGLLALFAQQQLLPTTLPPAPYRLRIGGAVGNPANEVEIENFFGQVVAFIPLPQQGVPAPGTLALVGLGLVLLRRGRR